MNSDVRTASGDMWVISSARGAAQDVATKPVRVDVMCRQLGIVRSKTSWQQSPHLILAVLQDLVICLLVLIHRLLHLDSIDLDAVQALREVRVEVELILIAHFPSLLHR